MPHQSEKLASTAALKTKTVLVLRSQQSELQKKLTEVRHQCELIKTKYETEAKYLTTLETKGSDNLTVQQNKIVENDENRVRYEQKLQKLNEDIAVSQKCINWP